jgi:hypothetical protein
MTKKEIRRIIERLQPIMRLERWKIETSFPEKLTNGDEALAEITRVGDYFEARLSIGPKYPAWTKKKAREILAHELAHLVFGDIDNYVASLHEQRVAPAELKLAQARYECVVEAAVDWVGVIVSDGIDW